MSETFESRLLIGALKRKQLSRPGYTQKVLARDLNVSAAFITNILSGKKRLPKSRLVEVCRLLELDIHEREALYTALLLGSDTPIGSLSEKRKQLFPKRSISNVDNSEVLSRWWNLAVLEALTLIEPLNDLDSIRKRTGLNQTQFDESIRVLSQSGMIEEVKGAKRKHTLHTYIPAGRSRRSIREFHEQMIVKARSELLTKTGIDDYQRRLITGFTFAVNPSRLELLKKKILEFADELSLQASDGECSEVYQFNVQFFPLLKPLAKK